MPAKVAARIVKWDFVEMQELLPEVWSDTKGGETTGKSSESQGKGKKRVQNIQVWIQYFAHYVSVLSGKHPEAVPELMAYTWWAYSNRV